MKRPGKECLALRGQRRLPTLGSDNTSEKWNDRKSEAFRQERSCMEGRPYELSFDLLSTQSRLRSAINMQDDRTEAEQELR